MVSTNGLGKDNPLFEFCIYFYRRKGDMSSNRMARFWGKSSQQPDMYNEVTPVVTHDFSTPLGVFYDDVKVAFSS
jgi:hypothetical protein